MILADQIKSPDWRARLPPAVMEEVPGKLCAILSACDKVSDEVKNYRLFPPTD